MDMTALSANFRPGTSIQKISQCMSIAVSHYTIVPITARGVPPTQTYNNYIFPAPESPSSDAPVYSLTCRNHDCGSFKHSRTKKLDNKRH